jgi:hypothetical protein
VEGAVELFRRSVSGSPDFFGGWFNLGFALHQLVGSTRASALSQPACDAACSQRRCSEAVAAYDKALAVGDHQRLVP